MRAKNEARIKVNVATIQKIHVMTGIVLTLIISISFKKKIPQIKNVELNTTKPKKSMALVSKFN